MACKPERDKNQLVFVIEIASPRTKPGTANADLLGSEGTPESFWNVVSAAETPFTVFASYVRTVSRRTNPFAVENARQTRLRPMDPKTAPTASIAPPIGGVCSRSCLRKPYWQSVRKLLRSGVSIPAVIILYLPCDKLWQTRNYLVMLIFRSYRPAGVPCSRHDQLWRH